MDTSRIDQYGARWEARDREEAREDNIMMREGARSGIPSRRLLGALPLARVIPQDLHSLMDYAGAAVAGISAALASSGSARLTGTLLASSGAGVSALTDYRMSVAKVVPIEVHETIDYVWGLSAIVAPFALGYHRKDRLATMLQVVTGASMVLASLFTDYRAARGVKWRRRD
jgi:hypothetical protein